MNEHDAKAKQIIEANIYMTMATSTSDGTPWAAPVYYAYDHEYTFYFVSAHDSRHSQQIRENPRVAVAIFDSTAPAGAGDGVQFDAHATEVTLTDLPHALTVYFKRRFTDEVQRLRRHDPARYSGIAKMRFYKVVPSHIYTLDPAVTDVDQRVEVHLT